VWPNKTGREWSAKVRIEFVEGEFSVDLTREELMITISALGWADSLIPSDEAFQEYVGWPRERFRSLVNELADAGRSGST
jgi:hypothetical protein